MSEEPDAQPEGQETALPDPDFKMLIAQFGAQAMMELGEIQNPISGKSEVSLTRAKFTIDVLQLIKDKTEGNLTPEEMQYVDGVLYELRTKFVQHQG